MDNFVAILLHVAKLFVCDEVLLFSREKGFLHARWQQNANSPNNIQGRVKTRAGI